MEVHHHTHSAEPGLHRRRKWTHYFWEFLMLFIAVTLGFFVENQREHIIENKRAKVYAGMFLSDLKSDTAGMGQLLRNLPGKINSLDSFILYLRKSQTEKIPGGMLYYHGLNVRWDDFYSINTSTLDQLKNSGSLRYFKNAGLAKLINEYDQIVTLLIRRTDNQDLIHRQKINTAYENVFDYFQLAKYLDLLMDTNRNDRNVLLDSLSNINIPLLNASKENMSSLAYAARWRRQGLWHWQNRFYKEPYDLATRLIEELKKEYHLE